MYASKMRWTTLASSSAISSLPFCPAIGPIAVGAPAVVAAVTDDAGLSALGLLSEVFQIKRADETLHADVDFLRLAVLDSADFNLR